MFVYHQHIQRHQQVLTRGCCGPLYEAVEACLSVDVQEIPVSGNDKVMEIAV
jgi:hypothetical protein